MFKNLYNNIKDFIKYLSIELIGINSTRIQLLYLTFTAWLFGMIYFGGVISWMRELSIIFYRQNSINAKPIDIDSLYGNTILGMLTAAFAGTVIAYVSSSMPGYRAQAENRKNSIVVDNNSSVVSKVEQTIEDKIL